MANTFAATGRTRLAWNLSEPQNVGTVSKAVERQAFHSITNGSGPNQATMAYHATVTVTGTSTTEIDLGLYNDNSFGYDGIATFSKLSEALIRVTTGPTGGYLLVGLPTGATGVRLNVGAQMHLASYLAGLGVGSSPSTISLKSSITGTYLVDVTAIGYGGFTNLV